MSRIVVGLNMGAKIESFDLDLCLDGEMFADQGHETWLAHLLIS